MDMLWTTHNCFSRLAAGYRGRFALLLLCLLCSMGFGQVDIGVLDFDKIYTGTEQRYEIEFSHFDYIKSGSTLDFEFVDHLKITDVVPIDGVTGTTSIGVRVYMRRHGGFGNIFGTSQYISFSFTNGELYVLNSYVHNFSYTFVEDYADVDLFFRVDVVKSNVVTSYRVVLDVPISSSSASFYPSYSPVLDIADEQYYDDLTSNFVSIGAVLLAVPLAIFFIYKGFSFIRGGFMVFLLLSSVFAFARGDTNPNPVSTGYIENTDGTTAFYADYVTNQQFADFAGVQTTETYDFESPYKDFDFDRLDNAVSNVDFHFGNSSAKESISNLQKSFDDKRFTARFTNLPIMMWPSAFVSSSPGASGMDTIYYAGTIDTILNMFDNNLFGFFSVRSAFDLLSNWFVIFLVFSFSFLLYKWFISN